MQEQELDDKLAKLKDLDDALELAKAEVKRLNEEYEQLNWEITQHFELTGTAGKKVHGKNFIMAQRTFSKIEDAAAFEAWVENNDAFKLLYARNANKLNAYCEEALKNGENIPDGVTPGFVKKYIQIRKG